MKDHILYNGKLSFNNQILLATFWKNKFETRFQYIDSFTQAFYCAGEPCGHGIWYLEGGDNSQKDIIFS